MAEFQVIAVGRPVVEWARVQMPVNWAFVGWQWMCLSIDTSRVHYEGNTMSWRNYFSLQNDLLQLSDLETITHIWATILEASQKVTQLNQVDEKQMAFFPNKAP